MNRSSFLTTSLTLAANAPAPLAIPESMLHPGSDVRAYGSPSPYERGTIRRPSGLASPALTPLAQQLGIITPSGLCFSRNHAGVPSIDPQRHRLLVHGRVRRARLFALEDIMRFPSVTRIHFIECAGNSARGWEMLGQGVQFSHGLVSCCEWTGVRLRDVLEETGAASDATWIVAEGADAAGFDRSIPMVKALDDAILAYGQNGEMLRPEQGYPLRLVLPGFEGSTSVKWLRRLKVVDGPVFSREETAEYSSVEPDGRVRLFDFTMGVKSVITAPSPGFRLAGPGFYEVRGFAWSGSGKIAVVEVSLDGGRLWSASRLDEPILSKSFTRFTAPLRWAGDALELQSRAVDEAGNMQPTMAAVMERRGLDPRYHLNAIATSKIGSNGTVDATSF